MNILEKENVLEVLKKININVFEVYVNEHIAENIKVGEEYTIYDIHKYIKEGMEKGIKQLWADNGIDYAELNEVLYVGTWNLSLRFNRGLISVWEEIGAYRVEWKQRKNASISNRKAKIIGVPYFKLKNKEELEKNNVITLYDMFNYYLEQKRQTIIENYLKDNMNMLEVIKSNEILIEKISKEKGL